MQGLRACAVIRRSQQCILKRSFTLLYKASNPPLTSLVRSVYSSWLYRSETLQRVLVRSFSSRSACIGSHVLHRTMVQLLLGNILWCGYTTIHLFHCFRISACSTWLAWNSLVEQQGLCLPSSRIKSVCHQFRTTSLPIDLQFGSYHKTAIKIQVVITNQILKLSGLVTLLLVTMWKAIPISKATLWLGLCWKGFKHGQLL